MTADPWFRTAVNAIAIIAIFTAVYLARSVLAPIACAFFIIAIVWPIQSRLQARLPKLLALALVVLMVVALFIAFASLVAWAFGRVGRWLVADGAQFQLLYEQKAAWLEQYGISIAALWAEHFNVRWLVTFAQHVTARVNTTITFWLVVLVFVVLGLLEVDDAARKVHALKNREAARVLHEGSVATAGKLRGYLAVRTLMSIATGALVWAFAALTGLQFAAEWGVIALVLNYIPFIGAFVATLLPTLFALAQFASWQAALAVFASLGVIQFVIGSYIEPRVAGRALAVSPFVVLVSVFLWTFLWGLFGAFIGVPITIAVLTFCAQHPSSRWLTDLLGAQGDVMPTKKPP